MLDSLLLMIELGAMVLLVWNLSGEKLPTDGSQPASTHQLGLFRCKE